MDSHALVTTANKKTFGSLNFCGIYNQWIFAVILFYHIYMFILGAKNSQEKLSHFSKKTVKVYPSETFPVYRKSNKKINSLNFDSLTKTVKKFSSTKFCAIWFAVATRTDPYANF